jgi:hypothetical protein
MGSLGSDYPYGFKDSFGGGSGGWGFITLLCILILLAGLVFIILRVNGVV